MATAPASRARRGAPAAALAEPATDAPAEPAAAARAAPARRPARATSGSAKVPAPRRSGRREAGAAATREAILRAATRIFAKDGFAGGRVDEISKAAKSYDRMIYYYFGSKEGLFIAVLEEMYRRFNDAEAGLALPSAQPVEALTAVIRFMWDYYLKNPEFITLLNTENLHRGRHISKSLRAREYSSPAIEVLDSVLASGARQGLFREGLAGRDIYLMIAGMGYFYLSNRYTLSAFLGERLDSSAALAQWEAFVIDAVLRTVRSDAGAHGQRAATVTPPLRSAA